MTVPPPTTPQNITTPNDSDPKLIKTQKRLHALVAHALTTGTLDLSHCTIDVENEFYLKASLIGNEIKQTNGQIHSSFALICKHSTFRTSLDFSSVLFKSEVDFSNTTFEQKPNFSKTIFENSVNFIETKFEHPLHTLFNETTFMQTARFSKILFNQTIDFSNINFKTLVFENITFGKEGNLQFRELPKLTEKASVTFKNINCDSDEVHIKIRRIPKEALITFNFEECHFYGKNVAFNTVHLPHVHITGGNNASGMAADHCYDVENTITPPPQVGFKY